MAGRSLAAWRGGRAGRAGVGALAALLTLLQLTSLAHLVLLPHKLCPEHGELVHGHGHEHGKGHALQRAPAEAEGWSALSAADASLPEPEDAHCSVFLLQRARVQATASAESALLQLATGPRILGNRGPAPRSVPILFVAPKSSPPLC